MKSLTIRNGDLVVGAGGFETVTGPDKVQQDLGLAVREPYGIDRFHVKWGSILERYIGSLITAETQALVRAEIIRVVNNYIAVQQAEIQRDMTNNRRSRFTTNEVVVGVKGLAMEPLTSEIRVQVSLETMGTTDVEIGVEIV